MPFSHQCLRAVLERIFDRTAIHLGDVLDALTGQAFLRHPSRQDPVFAEPAYLLSTVTYTEGKNPKDDFSALADILVELEDVMALVYLGNAYGLVPPKDIQQGLNCFERALRLQPEFPPALYNKGAVLAQQEHYTEALVIIEEALRLQPNFPEALYTKSLVLARLERYTEALEATERAVDLRPNDPMSWYYKAAVLVRLRHHEQAVVAYDQVLRLQPEFPHVWYYKGMILARLGHSQEAGEWLYRAWQARERLKGRDVGLIAQTLRDLGYGLNECEEQSPSDLQNSY